MDGEFLNVLNNPDLNQVESIDVKLSDAINIYARKSQVEELFKSYLHAFNNNEHDALWMPKTLQSFRKCCKGLHFETVIKVWTLMNEELKQANSNEIASLDLKKISPLLRLFIEFINNITLSQVPEKALIQITSCLVDTQNMAVCFVKLCLDSKNAGHMTRFLHLLAITGELVFKFPTLYQHFLIHVEPCGKANQLFSIGSIIVGFSDKIAGKVHKFMISQPDKISFLSWLNLLLFKIKCSSLNIWSGEALVSLCDFVVLELLDSIDFDQTDEYTSLFWTAICQSYHSIHETCARIKNISFQSYTSVFSKKLVQSLGQRGVYQDIAIRFFSHIPSSDLTSDFLNELCSKIIEKLCKILKHKHKKSKKIKNSSEMRGTVTVLESLNQASPQLMEASTQDLISSSLQSLLDDSIASLGNKTVENVLCSDDLLVILDTLEIYLLPFMNRLQKIKCTVASIAILCQGACDNNVTLRCLSIVVKSLHHIKCTHLLLKYLSPVTFCSWILSQYDYFSSRSGSDELILCKRIFNSFVSATLKNVAELKRTKPFFKKMNKDMKSSDGSLCNFEHVLMTSNLICKELNQQSINPECFKVLNKIGQKLLIKTNDYLRNVYEMNKEDWLLGEGGKYQSIIMETMVSLLKHSRSSNKVKDNEDVSEANNIEDNLPSFQKYTLIIIKSSKDSETVKSCLEFVKEICLRKSDLSQNEFLDTTFDVTYERLKQIAEKAINENVPSNPLEAQLSNLTCLLLLSMNKQKIYLSLNKLFSALDSKTIDWVDVHCAMKVWQSLLEQEMKEDIEETMIYSCQHIVISIQRLLVRNPPAFIVVSMLNTLSVLVYRKPNFLLVQDLSILLHFIHSINLESFPNKSTSSLNCKSQLDEFVNVFQSCHKVLDSILSSHPESVQCLVPTLTAAIKKLLQASMWGGQQLASVELSPHDLQDLERCARSVERLAASMQDYKLDFEKVAHLLVAEFSDCSQKVTLYPVIKMSLMQAVYSWLDMCNEHTKAQLQITLSAGAKEIFRDIYNEFQKYHKYRG